MTSSKGGRFARRPASRRAKLVCRRRAGAAFKATASRAPARRARVPLGDERQRSNDRAVVAEDLGRGRSRIVPRVVAPPTRFRRVCDCSSEERPVLVAFGHLEVPEPAPKRRSAKEQGGTPNDRRSDEPPAQTWWATLPPRQAGTVMRACESNSRCMDSSRAPTKRCLPANDTEHDRGRGGAAR